MISGRDLSLMLGNLLQESADPTAHHSDRPFNDVVIDSRKVQPGDLFVALAGETTDGHKFLDDAVQRGATGLLTRIAPAEKSDAVEVFVVADTLAALQQAADRWRRQQRVKVIGITGSAHTAGSLLKPISRSRISKPVVSSCRSTCTPPGIS